MKNKTRKNQRGSAILMVLGILSLALILGMSFAFSARSSLQYAKSSADKTKARLLAETARAQAMYILENFAETAANRPYLAHLSTPATGFPVLKNNTPAGNKRNHYFFSSKEGTSETDDYRAALVALLATPEMNNCMPALQTPGGLVTNSGFRPVYAPDPNAPTTNEIIGRFGYLILDDTFKLDLNQILKLQQADNQPLLKKTATTQGDNRANLSLTTSTHFQAGDFYYNLTGTNDSSATADNTNTVRLGNHLQELQVDNKYVLTPTAGTTLADHNGTSLANILIPWFSYKHLSNALGRANIDYDRYSVFSADDPDAYWDTDKLRQRFDLSGYEWCSDKSTFYDTAGTTINSATTGWSQNTGADLVSALVNSTARAPFYDNATPPVVQEPESYTASSTSFGIPYLNGLTSASGFSTGHQIAANMVDFCDADCNATVPSGSTKESLLTHGSAIGAKDLQFFGNENVPYINEFGLEFNAVREIFSQTIGDDTQNQYRYTVKLSDAYVEMLQIYPKPEGQTSGNNPAGQVTARIDATISVSDSAGGSGAMSETSFSTKTGLKECRWTAASGTNGTIGVVTPSGLTGITSGDSTVSFPIASPLYQFSTEYGEDTRYFTVTITIKQINILYHSEDGNDFYDLAIWKPDTAQTISFNLSSDAAVQSISTGGQNISFKIHVKDPRINHRLGDGYWEASTSVLGNDTPLSSWVSQNSFTNAEMTGHGATDQDLDKYTNINFSEGTDSISTFSTAFLPNRPFTSIWELGAIHRGELFKTLSLLGTDTAIVEQVKIGPSRLRRGVFNLNSLNRPAFQQLLNHIDITKYYPSTSVPTAMRPASNETTSITLPDAWNETTTTDYSIFNDKTLNRAGYATLFKDLGSPTTKREQEAAFGRTVGLLSTTAQRFVIVAVAQSMQKLEGVTASNFDDVKKSLINPVEYAGDYYSVRATQKMLVFVTYNAATNQFQTVRTQLIED